ncbi:hypothetical protein NHE_0622 [Neorickettsia helminthoeca str. Oregon]|uniref:Uncharacterized protein n=1 Tax=Neorickettsia helminthoeca str. Oregon TaxID=1286528 RepID=X5GX06_9RICK|nr:hypothetical protein [Neorickettsia helminthoeca]AHX11557.1 hypothetical protein NHE_0622 [Neorickettsia helminthoeca str. Oregon]
MLKRYTKNRHKGHNARSASGTGSWLTSTTHQDQRDSGETQSDHSDHDETDTVNTGTAGAPRPSTPESRGLMKSPAIRLRELYNPGNAATQLFGPICATNNTSLENDGGNPGGVVSKAACEGLQGCGRGAATDK